MTKSEEEFLTEVAENTPEPVPEEEVFEFDDEDELVKEIDSFCRVIAMGDKRRFVFLDSEHAPQFLSRRDAEIELAQYKLLRETKDGKSVTPVPGFKVWLEHPKRKPKFERVVFNPNKSEVAADELNLWTGFAVEPAPGDWSLMRAHMLENICQGNYDYFVFLMGILAQMFQEPWRKIGIAIVLRGVIGVGKTKLSEWLARIVGARHALVVDKAKQWTGRFNAQLEQNLFLAGEESLFAGDPEAKSAIKHLITSRRLAYERKGMDLREGPNFTRLLITTNEDWAVPASAGERRFFVLDVGSKRAKDGKYFAAIDAQMRDGGAAAMLHDLLQFDYSGIDFSKPPMTDALGDQVRLGFSPQMKWLESILVEGRLLFREESLRGGIELEPHGSEILKSEVVASYRDFVPGFRSPATPQHVGIFLAKHVPGLSEVRRRVAGEDVRYWRLPALAEMREAFLKSNLGYNFPPEPVTELDADSSSPVVLFRRPA